MQQLIASLFEIEMPIRKVGHCFKSWGFTPQKPVKRSYERCSKRVKKWLD
ncbi:MAG: helix-turn-helix domain-containing protein [Akkermansiaceae bacterium]